MKKNKHRFFIEIAEKYSQNGTCPKVKVGALLVRNKRIIAAGYNGAPIGLPHCDEIDPQCYEENNHCENSLHAEEGLLLFCAANGIKTKDSILYTTKFPCKKCTQKIIQCGIKKVYFKEDYKNEYNIFSSHLDIRRVSDVSDAPN